MANTEYNLFATQSHCQTFMHYSAMRRILWIKMNQRHMQCQDAHLLLASVQVCPLQHDSMTIFIATEKCFQALALLALRTQLPHTCHNSQRGQALIPSSYAVQMCPSIDCSPFPRKQLLSENRSATSTCTVAVQSRRNCDGNSWLSYHTPMFLVHDMRSTISVHLIVQMF